MSVPAAGIRAALAQSIQMLTRAEIMDYSGHASARRSAETFHINAGASIRATLTEADIVAVDAAGTLVEGSARPPLEFHLHAAIYRARPDVQVIMHTHPRWSTYLTMTGTPYQPVFAQGVLVAPVPVLDTPLSVNTAAAGAGVASALGDGRALLLKSHGGVVVGADLLECFALAVYLEENARRQYMARQIGTPYVFSSEEQAVCRHHLWSASLFRKAWDHYASQL